MRKILIYFLLPAFVVMQLFQPDRNTSTDNFPADIGNIHAMPDSIENTVTKICYDCHSNNSNYPWFTNIQPIGWYVQNKINKGKSNLNFAEFGKYDTAFQIKKLDRIKEMISSKTMPPNSYKWYNKAADISDAQRKGIIDWAMQLKSNLEKKPAKVVKDTSSAYSTK